jgi:hypothetical protein
MTEAVVVTRNSARFIGPCIESLLAANCLPVIVDNGSADNTLEIVRSRSNDARIIATGENLGYGKAMNLGFRETRGEIVILSNPDVVYLEHSIRKLTELLESNVRIGVVGPQQMFPDRTWQRSYGELPGLWSGIKDASGITTLKNAMRRGLWPRKLDSKEKDVPYVDGAVLAVRRKAFLEMGGFDEAFYFYSDESDLCARLRKAGWRVVFLPTAEVIHVRGADSMKVDRSDRFVRYLVQSQALLASKHLPAWQASFYSKLQICQFARLGALQRIARGLTRSKESTADYKIWLADTHARIWKEFARCPDLAFSPFDEGRHRPINKKASN